MTGTFSQAFESDGEYLTRVFNTPTGPRRSRVPDPGTGEERHRGWWRQYWNGEVPEPDLGPGPQREIRTAEIFCGPGGLAQGVKQACLELGYKFSSKLAIDNDHGAVAVYRRNHGTELPWKGSIVGSTGCLVADCCAESIPPRWSGSDSVSLPAVGLVAGSHLHTNQLCLDRYVHVSGCGPRRGYQ